MNHKINLTIWWFMNLADLKKALMLGVEFRFTFVASSRFDSWAVGIDRIDGSSAKGDWIQAARGDTRRFATLDAAVRAVVRAGAPAFKPDRYQLVFDNPVGQKKGQLDLPGISKSENV